MDIDKIDEKHSLTLEKYITNPTDTKGNLVLNLSMVKESLTARYDVLLKNNNFKLEIYKTTDSILAHVFVPSEKYDLTYDVVLELIDYKEKDKPYKDKLLKNINFRLFSNSPAFTFTYAYVFYKRGLLIPKTEAKYEKEVLQRQPFQRNYYQITNIEKSIFYAIHKLLDSYTTVGDLEAIAKPSSITFWSNIETTTNKIKEYAKVKAAYKSNKEKESKKVVRKEAVGRVLKGKSATGDIGRIITGKSKITGSTNSHKTSKRKGKSKIK